MRLASFLWTGVGQPPPELLRYRLRMMYGCTPSQLARERGKYLFEMLRDLRCQEMEARTARRRMELSG